MRHELLVTGQGAGWHEILWGDSTPLIDHLPAAAVALFLDIHIRTGNRKIGLRKYGSAHSIEGEQLQYSHQLGIVGLDANKRCEASVELISQCEVHAEGAMLACGGAMFDRPIEVTPPGNLSWETIDLSSECPGATGILFEVWFEGGGISTGIRKHGSTDARKETAYHCWGVVGCDENQKIDYFVRDYAGWQNRLWIVGYISGLATFNTNAPDKSPSPAGAYQIINIPPPAKLIFLEITSPGTGASYALRSKGSVYDAYYHTNYMHNWAVVPADIDGDYEAKLEYDVLKNFYIGEGH